MQLFELPPISCCSVLPRAVALAIVPVVLAASLAACSASASKDAVPTISMSQPANSDSLPAALRADAAQRGHVPADQVELISGQAVTWRDGSLGCPEPGRNYTQALVPGYRIRVRAGQETITYHADQRGRWVWCPPGRAVEPLDPAS